MHAMTGLGMNKEELERNPVLTESVVHDLNVDPKLPYEDNAFDVITNTVSVDYLTKPKEVHPHCRSVLLVAMRHTTSHLVTGSGLCVV